MTSVPVYHPQPNTPLSSSLGSDFDSLSPEDVYKNNALAFETAETSLSVPALLDPQDMVDYEVPDRLSILTYVSQFYQAFVGQQGTWTGVEVAGKGWVGWDGMGWDRSGLGFVERGWEEMGMRYGML